MILKTYNNHLYKKEKIVGLKKDNIKFNATIKYVNAFGELVVDNGVEQNFKFGEVVFC